RRRPGRQADRPLQGQSCAGSLPAPPGVFRPRAGVEERTGGGGRVTQSLTFLLLLLVLSCLTLAGLGLSGLMVARAQEQRQKLDARLSAAVAPHVRVQRATISAFTPPVKTKDRSLFGFVTWLFRFDPAKSDQYSLHWAL